MEESQEESEDDYVEIAIGRTSLRKRKSLDKEQRKKDDIELFYEVTSKLEKKKNILIFSGSGLSHKSGMSTFSQKGGLYERARKKFKIKDGMRLFFHSFYAKHPKKCLAFLSEVYFESLKAKPTKSHHIIAQLEEMGRLIRHYTMNVDSLHRQVSSSIWTGDLSCSGKTVELHGSCRELLCTQCERVSELSLEQARMLKSGKSCLCKHCNHPLRIKIMLYDDADSELIMPSEVMDLVEEDAQNADLILWIGISFQQSASLEYFRKVRKFLIDEGKGHIPQAIINPDEDAIFNVFSASNNLENLNLLAVQKECDTVLSRLLSSDVDNNI